MSPVGKGLYLGQQASVILVLLPVLLCQLPCVKKCEGKEMIIFKCTFSKAYYLSV